MARSHQTDAKNAIFRPLPIFEMDNLEKLHTCQSGLFQFGFAKYKGELLTVMHGVFELVVHVH